MAYTSRTIESRSIWQGEDVSWVFTAENSLTGGSVAWELTTEEGGGTTELSKSGSINGTQFTITLTDTETAALDAGKYWHEAKFTDNGGLVSQLIAPSPIIIYASAI